MNWEPAGKKNDMPPAVGNGGANVEAFGSGAQVTAKEAKRKPKKLGCLVAVVVVIAIVFAFRAISCSSEAARESPWPTSGLAAMLPTPEKGRAEIVSNSDDRFYAHVNNYSESSYESYLSACKESGFVVDARNDTIAYRAYSEEGYHLSLLFDSYSKVMSVELEAPAKMSDLSWKATGLWSVVPAPVSHEGAVEVDSSSHLYVLVGNTSEADYKAYVDSCVAYGVNVDYSRSDTVFSAENAAGDSVRVEYEGFSTMSISIYAAKEDSAAGQADTSGETASSDSSAADAGAGAPSSGALGVTPEFKEAMDSYEAFMDEYVEFMGKYANSDDPSSMMGDYASYMQRYSECMQKIDAIDEDSLSDADMAYYIEVTGRVAQKLQSLA